MKSNFTIICIVSVLVMPFSCKKDLATLNFNLSYQVSFTIPATTGINLPVSVPTPDVTTNSSQQFKNEGTNASLVSSVTLNSLKLTITNPSGQTFTFLKSVQIYLSAPGLSEKEVAFINEVPNNPGNSLNLNVTGEDLSGFIKSNTFSMRMQVIIDQTLLQDITVQANMDFAVTAKLL